MAFARPESTAPAALPAFKVPDLLPPEFANVKETLGACEAYAAMGARAVAIVDQLLSLQDVDPFSRTYGIWSWYLEEPLSEMAPPDWNWADFCGARLAMILTYHADSLPAELVE